jgi:hypothetical protein
MGLLLEQAPLSTTRRLASIVPKKGRPDPGPSRRKMRLDRTVVTPSGRAIENYFFFFVFAFFFVAFLAIARLPVGVALNAETLTRTRIG